VITGGIYGSEPLLHETHKKTNPAATKFFIVFFIICPCGLK